MPAHLFRIRIKQLAAALTKYESAKTVTCSLSETKSLGAANQRHLTFPGRMVPRVSDRLPSQRQRDTSVHSKTSPSFTSSSNEADDEWSASDLASMGLHPGTQQFEGEDTRPTSRKELRGFYIYAWASEVCSESC